MKKLDALLEKAGNIYERPSGRTRRPFDDEEEEDNVVDDFVVEYDIEAEEPTLDGVDKTAVTPLVKVALAKKRREEMLSSGRGRWG